MTTLAADSDLLDALGAVRRLAQHGTAVPDAARAALSRYGEAGGPPFEPGARDAVRAELEAIVLGRHVADALRVLRDTGALARLVPELAAAIGFDQRTRHHDLQLDEHLLQAVAAAAELDASLRVRLAALFHDAGKPESGWQDDDGHWHYYGNAALGKEDHQLTGSRLARRALERLGFDARLVDEVTRLIESHMVWPTRRRGRLRELRERLGDDLLDELFVHRRADTLGKAAGPDVATAEMLADLDEMQRQLELVRRQDGERG